MSKTPNQQVVVKRTSGCSIAGGIVLAVLILTALPFILMGGCVAGLGAVAVNEANKENKENSQSLTMVEPEEVDVPNAWVPKEVKKERVIQLMEKELGLQDIEIVKNFNGSIQIKHSEGTKFVYESDVTAWVWKNIRN